MYPLEPPWKSHRFRAARQIGSNSMAKQEPETSIALVASPVLGQMIGSDRATAAGITVRGPAPVLALCRKLVGAGVDPNRPLHAYRGDVLCLVVRTIGEGARLTVAEGQNAPRFRLWEPMPSRVGSPRIARTEREAGGPPIPAQTNLWLARSKGEQSRPSRDDRWGGGD